MNVCVRALVALLFLLSFSSPSAADTPSMTLAWDPVKDSAVRGYVLSYGTASRSYSRYLDVGKVTVFTVGNLAHGTTYYFAVRAYDAEGRLSAPSGEVSATTKPGGSVPDTTPHPFAFTARTDVTLSTVVTSSPVPIWGIDTPTPMTISGGTFSISGGPFTTGPSTVANGQAVVVRLTSSGSYSRAVTATVTVGGVSGAFRVTTMAAPGEGPRDDEPRDDAPRDDGQVGDTTPNAFAFGSVTGAARNTVVTSNAIAVAGINASAPISISGGAFSISGGSFRTGAATVTNGQTVVVRLTSSKDYGKGVEAILTIGGVSGVFRVTTAAAAVEAPRDDEADDDAPVDTTPDGFALGKVSGAGLDTAVTSNAVTVTGINAPAPVSISGGAFSINGGSFRTGPATVTNGQRVVVRLTSASTYETEVRATLTIGGVSRAFRVSTMAAPVDETRTGGLPASPTGFVATVRDDRTIELTWSAMEDWVQGFRIEVGSAYGLSDVSSFTTGVTSRFTLSGLAPGTYYLRVRGVSEAGPGDPSDEVVATVEAPAPLPGMPTGLYYLLHNKSVILVWTAPVDGGAPSSYVMEATDTKGKVLATVDTGSTMTFMLHDPGGAGTYVARIRAANSAGLGPASAPVTVVIPK